MSRLLAACGLGLALAGCNSTPSKANIDLRKDNQKLQAQVDDLRRQHEADHATILGIQSRVFNGPVLSQERLARLVTVAGLKFGILTGGYHPDPNVSGDTMVKVYVVPTDEQGDAIKAAGSFHIELFDLALESNNRIGTWDFDLPGTAASWEGKAFLYTYVLSCPWQTAPTHGKLLLRVTFSDELTHRVFTEERDVKVEIGK